MSGPVELIGHAVQSELRRVGSFVELRSGKKIAANLGDGRRVAVFIQGDQVFATQGRCPHASGPLHEGEVCNTTLTCPWHGWSFDLVSGVCEEDPALVLERFEVVISGDDILVRV